LEAFLKSLPKFTLVIVSAKDEASKKLSKGAKKLFEGMGSKEVSKIGFRESWAFVGLKGARNMAVE